MMHSFLQRSESWPTITKILAPILILWLTATLLNRLSALGPGHFLLRRFMGFPPVWVAAVLGCVVGLAKQWHGLYEAITLTRAGAISWTLISVVTILTGPALALLADQPGRAYFLKCCSRKWITPSAPDVQPQQDLMSWVADERPINTPDQDRFGVAPMAERVARALRMKSIQTVGIVGPYGTGKTSLLNLVEFYLDRPSEKASDSFDGEIVICRVDGWGRIKGSAAEMVLALSVERIASMVDCLSIRSLPADYRRAIEGTNWFGSAILSVLLDTSPDPVIQLRKLDDILLASGIRLVIVLEDLDRNTADEIVRDEVPALLDRLRGMKNISFVLAIGTEHAYSHILVRICDCVESLA
jgi:hypothetical protein